MSDAVRTNLPTDALIVGYVMSRLDRVFLTAFQFDSWKQAFTSVGERLNVRPSSLKNLRDEFDPLHGNSRVGWWRRAMRDGRRRVHEEFAEVDDGALLSLASTIVGTSPALKPPTQKTSQATSPAFNAAARLRTGREAEELFTANCEEILSVRRSAVLDMRDSLAGFDYRLHRENPPWLVEVKGLRKSSGKLLFTDLEWQVASRTRDHYVLVVVHSLDSGGRWSVVVDPFSSIRSVKKVERRVVVAWESPFTAPI